MRSTVPASLINDTLSVITDTCAVDIINCLSPGRVRWGPVVTQQAGNRAGISVCLLPKPLVPPSSHTHCTENTNAISFAANPASSPCSGHYGCWFLPWFLVCSEPRMGNSFGIQNTHRQGASLFDEWTHGFLGRVEASSESSGSTGHLSPAVQRI